MIRKIITVTLFLTLLFTFQRASAQENSFSLKPSGRILMDAGLFSSKNKDFANGAAIPDVRIGLKASYGTYKAKIDMGFGYGKLSLKDVFIEKQFGASSLLRLGYFVHQFGLQSSTSSSMKVTMEEPISNAALFNSRLLGAMYVFSKDQFFATASIHVENEAIKKATNETGDQGYGAMSRLVYRPFKNDGKIFHVGISGAIETPRYSTDPDQNHSSFVLSANYPSRIAKVKALEANITDAKRLFKFTPELLFACHRIGLETQYYYMNVARKDGFKNYKATGAYALVRGLILGGSYKYSDSDSGLSTPAPGSLECVLGYNYTDMSDREAGILGGRLNDASVTFNYYINKYMIWRFRYSYTHVSNSVLNADNQSVNAFQTRLQILF